MPGEVAAKGTSTAAVVDAAVRTATLTLVPVTEKGTRKLIWLGDTA